MVVRLAAGGIKCDLRHRSGLTTANGIESHSGRACGSPRDPSVGSVRTECDALPLYRPAHQFSTRKEGDARSCRNSSQRLPR
jgi:hypothetical protein